MKAQTCEDCGTEMVVDVETSELVCESCGRVEELFGEIFVKFQISTHESFNYLRKILEKHKIKHAVNTTTSYGREVYDPERYRFLGNIIKQFGCDGKSVNFICFLYDYFQAVSSEDWPRKKEIIELLSPHLPKIPKTRRRAKERFDEWWAVQT